MKRRLATALCVMLICQSILSSCTLGSPTEISSQNMQDVMERVENEKSSQVTSADATATIYSEYDMLLQKVEELEAEDASAADTLLSKYEEEIWRRAGLSQETLLQYGYSEDEITLLKAYRDGTLSFEEAALLTSAELEADLRTTQRSATSYALRYDWEWDKVPTGLGEDGVALTYYGIDANNDGFNIRLASYESEVNYYTLGNEFKEFDEGTVDLVWDNLSITFDSYKLDESGYEWVWAKDGYLAVTIEPATPGTDEFDSVRALASYGHSAAQEGSLQITHGVNVLDGLLSIGFSTGGKENEVIQYDVKQCYFYLDGSTHIEIG